MDLDQTVVSYLAWIPGACRLVCFDGEPASIPAAMLAIIKNKVDSINAAGGKFLETIQPGNRVVISPGPFRGYEGIFDIRLDGNERVRVLLNLLQNRQMRLEVPVGLMQLQIITLAAGNRAAQPNK